MHSNNYNIGCTISCLKREMQEEKERNCWKILIYIISRFAVLSLYIQTPFHHRSIKPISSKKINKKIKKFFPDYCSSYNLFLMFYFEYCIFIFSKLLLLRFKLSLAF